MFQQLIALFLIVFFLSRLVWQRKKGKIGTNEFVFWLIFWVLASLAIIFLKWIDAVVAKLGFSGSGINVLLYLGVAISFYFIFKLRLKLEKIDKDLTKLTRVIAIGDKERK